MSFNEIQMQFLACHSWEERYRLLVKLSRILPQISEEDLATLSEISGCESRLWFDFQVQPRQVQAYSDARLMQGILVIILAYLETQSDEDLGQLDLQALFNTLNIAKHLTSTRLNGIAQIERMIRQSV